MHQRLPCGLFRTYPPARHCRRVSSRSQPREGGLHQCLVDRLRGKSQVRAASRRPVAALAQALEKRPLHFGGEARLVVIQPRQLHAQGGGDRGLVRAAFRREGDTARCPRKDETRSAVQAEDKRVQAAADERIVDRCHGGKGVGRSSRARAPAVPAGKRDSSPISPARCAARGRGPPVARQGAPFVVVDVVKRELPDLVDPAGEPVETETSGDAVTILSPNRESRGGCRSVRPKASCWTSP